jgi:hypothetical protein
LFAVLICYGARAAALFAQPGSASRRTAVHTAAAVAEKMSSSSFSQFSQPAGKGLGWYSGEDGYLYCDNLRVDDIRHQVTSDRHMTKASDSHMTKAVWRKNVVNQMSMPAGAEQGQHQAAVLGAVC